MTCSFTCHTMDESYIPLYIYASISEGKKQSTKEYM